MARPLTGILAAMAVCAAAGSAAAERVELVSGEVLNAPVIERNARSVTLDHPILGRLVVPADKVASVSPDGAARESSPAAPPAAPPAPPSVPAPTPPDDDTEEEESPWTWSGELGLNGSTGNSETQDLHAAVEALLEDDSRRWATRAGYARSEQDGETTKDETYLESQHDWLLPGSPWFYFGRLRWDRDDFQDWDSRLEVGGGVGRELIAREDLALRARAGLVGIREFGGEDDSWRPEALVGSSATWRLGKRQKLEATTTLYPDLEEGGEYRWVNSLSYAVKLSDEGSVALKAGLEHEFDSHREEPFDENDVRYYLALLFTF